MNYKDIYIGQEIDCFKFYDEHYSKDVLIYFDHAGSRLDFFSDIMTTLERAKPIGNSFYKRNFTVYVIICKQASFYQTMETPNLLKIIHNQHSGCRFLYIGFSMGGYAAINFSYLHNPIVLSFQPQFSLNNKYPLSNSLKIIHNKIGDIGSTIELGFCVNTQGYIFYDNTHAIDNYHAEKILKNTSLKPICVPFTGHPTSTHINKYYKIPCIARDVMDNKFNELVFNIDLIYVSIANFDL